MGELTEKLNKLTSSDLYPFHMPGHKRRIGILPGEVGPEQFDITEINGFDDLHDPQEVLLRLEERISRLWGAEHSWIGVNGSTGMLLAAISAAKRSGRFLVARNCHKSVYHACELLSLQVDYLVPELTDRGIFFGIRAEAVREAVKTAMENGYCYDAVVLTSPTYEGLVSEIKEISTLLRDSSTLLIVDEAHGAHFPFRKDWGLAAPESARALGADLVIQSTHKTLPAFTQTALLHAGARVDEELLSRLRHYLNIYQTSSPSYLFMSSLDTLADLLESEEGRELGRAYVRNLEKFYRENASLKHYHVLENNEMKDPSKLVIFCEEPFGGATLADRLRDRYHLEVEMAAPGYVIAMTSLADSAEGFERLTGALRELDQIADDFAASTLLETNRVENDSLSCAMQESGKMKDGSQLHRKKDTEDFSLWNLEGRIGERIESAGEAFARKESDCLLLSLEECVRESNRECVGGNVHDSALESGGGSVCDHADKIDHSFLEAADYVWLYPPGIPFLVPGERILPKTAEVIVKLKESGYHICGTRRADGKIYVIPHERKNE